MREPTDRKVSVVGVDISRNYSEFRTDHKSWRDTRETAVRMRESDPVSHSLSLALLKDGEPIHTPIMYDRKRRSSGTSLNCAVVTAVVLE